MSTVELVCPGASDNDGAFALQWSGPGSSWRLEENGAVRYEGPDLATTLTGRPAGIYEYRVGTVEDGAVAAWSPRCTVEVAPPALGLALALAAVGAIVFVATVWLVASESRRGVEERAR